MTPRQKYIFYVLSMVWALVCMLLYGAETLAVLFVHDRFDEVAAFGFVLSAATVKACLAAAELLRKNNRI